MADAPVTAPADGAKPDAQPTIVIENNEILTDAGKKALDDERKARRDAEKSAKTLQAELDTLKQQSMSDAEKIVTQRVTEAVTPLQQQNARLQVAIAKGIPADLVDRLRGETVEEIEADADALLALFKKDETEEDKPPRIPDLAQGPRNNGENLALGSDALTEMLTKMVTPRQ